MKIIPPEILLEAYSQGIFPMADSREDKEVDWYSARKRGVIPLNEFHMTKNVMRIVRQGRFEVRVDENFREVVKACADRENTWINDLILNSYDILNQSGNAHSVEVYKDEKLAGGLYGVTLGGAFFGESMFRKEKEADKVALYYCHQILKEKGFILWDTQFYTGHLGRFGCKEIEAKEYGKLLEKALKIEAKFSL
ncbi:MAG: leucyl/phenylalanyl-tRNA--protein transferase [Balneola sp.]|nr:leucyl/phenylalanyl-tRNA--protein transferase [Balneola sp.]MBO6649755.1 leucyl/phenylalanyl-tRNA--protein transferase [Balneola sp.]MBO6712318.1 leucyl/phenylalanyl-tRNA--protein transferase [Balneola sp.]MBO6800512.1 leucyl/phenylalanyl-tRNA--protein transferase [Balneola sp.]MBO6871466.1 leucyl/phenylalanyl-tRNA--protein transferase [Balneola sp.]